MIHLPALPGSPKSTHAIDVCVDLALQDARALVAGGADALLIENFNDVPFRRGRVGAHTVAVMTRICLAIREATDLPIGINVLRNDASAALGIALACDAQFMRVNVHTGVMVTDQGLITGAAAATLRLRRSLDAEHIKILADILVKHAVPLGIPQIEDVVSDAVDRGLADGVIVSGSGTGKVPSQTDLERAVRAASTVPVYIGSGVDISNLAMFLPPAYGAIVGSSLKESRNVVLPVDVERVRALRAAFDRQLDVAGIATE